MKSKINYFGIITAIVIAGSIFLPWVSAAVGGTEADNAKGFDFDDVKITLLVALVGAFFAFRRTRWGVIVIGILCLLQGLLHLGWYLFADKIASDNTSGTTNLNPAYGLYIFLIASTVFIFSTKKAKRFDITTAPA